MFVPIDGSVLSNTSYQPSSDDKILQANNKEFKSNFNQHPFKFHHTLHRSGLFEVPRIAELAKLMIEKNGNFSALNFKNGSIDTKFGDAGRDVFPPWRKRQLDQAGSGAGLRRRVCSRS